MAASTANGTPATPTLPEEVSKPPEGVVLPPKDIRGKSLCALVVFAFGARLTHL